jgi:MFS family permease
MFQSAQMQFYGPAEQATVADAVADQDLPAAMSANSVAGNVTRLAGPALGGVLVTLIGFTATTTAISAVLAAAAILLSLLPSSPQTASARRSILHDWIDGLHLTARQPHARSVAVFQILDSIKEGPLSALFPVLMLGTIGSTAAYMGTVNSSFAVTAILGAPLVGLVTRRLGYRWPIAAGATISGGLLLLLAGLPNHATALTTFLLAGFPFTISWVAANTWLLANTKPAQRGRVTGTTSTLNAAATATFAAVAGAAAQTFPVPTVLAAAAGVEILAGPVFLIMTRHMNREPTIEPTTVR